MLKTTDIKLGTLLNYRGRIVRIVADSRNAPMNPFNPGRWELIIRDFDPGTGEFGECEKVKEEDLLSAILFDSVLD